MPSFTFHKKQLLWLLLILPFLAGLIMVGQTEARPDVPEAINGVGAWSTAVTLSASPHGETPVIRAAPNGNLMVAYAQFINANGIDKPYYRVMPEGSSTWSTAAPIHNTGSMEAVDLVRIAIGSNNVAHAVWIGEDSGKVYYSRQDQWPTTAVELHNGLPSAIDPAITIGGNGHIHVVWSQGTSPSNIYYTRSTDNGASWSTPEQVTAGNDAIDDSDFPNIAVDNQNNIHVVWQQAVVIDIIPPDIIVYGFEIHHKQKTAEGTWPTNPTRISADPAQMPQALQPNIITSGNIVHVSFVERISQVGEFVIQQPQYTRYNGSSWSSPVAVGQAVYINTQSPFFVFGTMAECDGRLSLYYHGGLNTNTPEQILGVSNSGSGWTTVERATESTLRLNVFPALACQGGNLFLVYQSVLPDGGEGIPRVDYVERKLATYLPMVRK